MKILVCGGRDYFNAERVDQVLDLLGPTFVVHGDARGADSLAANWAAKRGVPHQCFVADWQQYGNSAGPKRNLRMLLEGKPAMVVAFPGGSGTGDMIGQAMQRGVPVVEVR